MQPARDPRKRGPDPEIESQGRSEASRCPRSNPGFDRGASRCSGSNPGFDREHRDARDAHALFYALPADADEREKAAVQLVVERGDVIDRILNARQDVVGSKAELVAFGACWGGLYDALVAKARLPADMSPTASLAARIIDTIFHDGIMFIRLPAAAAWADGDRRYDRIVELERFRKAVLPIGEYREGVRARGGREEDVDVDPGVTPPTPVEPMPGVPNNGGPPFVDEDPAGG